MCLNKAASGVDLEQVRFLFFLTGLVSCVIHELKYCDVECY